jgi:GxxExxY protein
MPAQLLNYLAMSGLQRGLLINFGPTSLEYKRRVL